jgi:D-alanyl-D-alanine carboxypeptidase
MVNHAPPLPRLSASAPTVGFQIAIAAIVISALMALLTIRLPSGRPDGVPELTASPTSTASPTASPTPTPTPTPTQSPTPTPSPTPVPTPEPTPAPTPMPTPVPTVAPQPTAPPPPSSGPPACAYTDVLTQHFGYGEWPISLLDTIFHLPADYAPGDLVDSATAGLNGGYLVRTIVLADLSAMAADARAAGTPIALASGYRSYAQQQSTFDYWVSVGGYKQALRTSARAGHSEHQLGTAIDVTSEGGAPPWEYGDWASTPAGAWMAANAWRYGFVMSYPYASYDASCYDYEPWHYRYVGRDLAAHIAATGRVPRLVLWELQ